ncbi:MAG: hypothetical protein CMI12_08160 [Oceanospirillum sp.]|nr:hypothetical protein [Oceanospirillum sp.]
MKSSAVLADWESLKENLCLIELKIDELGDEGDYESVLKMCRSIDSGFRVFFSGADLFDRGERDEIAKDAEDVMGRMKGIIAVAQTKLSQVKERSSVVVKGQKGIAEYKKV